MVSKVGRPPFKNSGNSWGEGGHQRPPGMENPGGWVGGMDIFWNHTSHAEEKYQKMEKAVIQKKPKANHGKWVFKPKKR